MDRKAPRKTQSDITLPGADRRLMPDRRWQDVPIMFADRRRSERRQTAMQAMLWSVQVNNS